MGSQRHHGAKVDIAGAAIYTEGGCRALPFLLALPRAQALLYQ